MVDLVEDSIPDARCFNCGDPIGLHLMNRGRCGGRECDCTDFAEEPAFHEDPLHHSQLIKRLTGG